MAITILTNTLSVISLWFLSWIVLLLIRYATDIKKLFLEPVLKDPVVIFESDDWGTGPLKQQEALTQINSVLSVFKDSNGQHPVMTLGIILAEPDKDRILASNCQHYYQRTLASNRYATLLQIIQKGINQGIFSIHLHGMTHFWPATLMKSMPHNLNVEKWLLESDEYLTEDLPSELQSRWVDSSNLPSSNHNQDAIDQAVDEELLLYQTIFGQAADTVVPPTFVWTNIVEQAYAARGIETLITPGRQCTGRDSHGAPKPNGRYFLNAQEQEGLLYLVRDTYFEPSLGHKAETTLQHIADKTSCGRPALLEMHRFNFIETAEKTSNSLQELEKLLALISHELSDVNYISAKQLAKIYKDYKQGINTGFIEISPTRRCKILLSRIKLLFKFNRLAKYSGVNLLLKLV